MATDKQTSFLSSLMQDRQVPSEWSHVTDPSSLSTRDASMMIGALLDSPRVKVATTKGTPDVPAGRYAVETNDGHLAFYKVDRPEGGRWDGWTFVKVQAGDEWHNIRGKVAAFAILDKIAADGPANASARYGHEIGSCGICGRTLTDEVSRERGIGPVCAERYGW